MSPKHAVFSVIGMVVTVGSFILAAVAITGCEITTVDHQQQVQQEQLLAEADREVGLPKITHFTEKKLLSMLYEMRDQASLPTWTYYLDMHGKRHLLCRSIGYGMPYATQFSNPQKITTIAGHPMSLPQAEPNGMFSATSADGTWVFMATDKGPKPLYVEPKIIVSPVELPDEGPALADQSPGNAQKSSGTKKKYPEEDNILFYPEAGKDKPKK